MTGELLVDGYLGDYGRDVYDVATVGSVQDLSRKKSACRHGAIQSPVFGI